MDAAQRYEVLRATLGVGGVVPPTIDPDLALSEEDLRALSDMVVPEVVPPGKTIMREGDLGDSLYIVGAGRLRIVRAAEGGEIIPVAELGPGAIVGELALLEGRERSATVIAETEAELVRFDRPLLKRLLSERSPLAYKMLFALTLHVSARVRKKDVEELEARAESLEALVRQRTLELERSLDRESMINLITGAIRGHLDLDRVLQTTVEQVGRALQASRCMLVLEGPEEIIHRIEHDYAAPGLPSARGVDMPHLGDDDPVVVHMRETRRPYAVDDVEKDPMTTRVTVTDPKFIEAIRGTRSVMLVPLFFKEEFLGTVSLYTNTLHAWSEEEKDFAQAIADQVAVAIRQSQLYWELAQQKDRLSDALEELKNKELQLIQSEKMAGLGQLVAGVAHELNNPISIVYGFLGHVGRRLDALREALAKGGPVDGEATFTELEDMLSRCKEGALRTKNIVTDLRTFSRLDEADFKEVDIHAGLESTLHLLEHRMGDRVSVHRHYGDLPYVACYAGQLNQVFMNLLSNAMDAIEAKGGEGEVHVTTSVIEGEGGEPRVAVAIRDTGGGIPAEKLSRIFDPFYTTKPVGLGTGLGLSVSHGIVAKHGGEIRVESVPGQGSTFTVDFRSAPEAPDPASLPAPVRAGMMASPEGFRRARAALRARGRA
jgi:signal transduction histidine kinase/CRP-like cAMP-binding protein